MPPPKNVSGTLFRHGIDFSCSLELLVGSIRRPCMLHLAHALRGFSGGLLTGENYPGGGSDGGVGGGGHVTCSSY